LPTEGGEVEEEPPVDSSPRAYWEYVQNTRPPACRKQLRPGISKGWADAKKSDPMASNSALVRKLYWPGVTDSSMVTPKS
jgi:hypothetical protein